MAEKKVSSENKIVATAGVYDILVRPVISEKSAKLSETLLSSRLTRVITSSRGNPSAIHDSASKVSAGKILFLE